MNKISSLSATQRGIYIIVAAMCMVATFPGRTHGLGLITESILRDLSMDRTVYGYYNLWATLIGALFCIPVGSMLDRSGCRKILTLVLSGLGVSVLCMSMVHNNILFFILLVLVRGFGQSALSVASITLISKYFPKSKLGFAMGIYSVLVSVFFMGAFGGMGAALDYLNPQTVILGGSEIVLPAWRIAWGSVGVILLAVCVPVILLCVRSRQSISIVEETPVSQPSSEVEGIPFFRAICTAAFWVFALSISFFNLVSSGIGLHNEDILLERGFDAKMYHFLMILPLPFGLLSNLVIGYLARYVRISYLLAFSLFFTGIAKFLFPFIQTSAQVYAYTIIFSIAGGGLTVLFFIAWADIFGKRDLGRIQGLAQMITVIASAMGPIFFAYSKEWTNSYTPAFYISGGLTILFAVAACLIRMPSAHPAAVSDRMT
jgi:MFS family permease